MLRQFSSMPFNYRSRSHLTEMLWKDRYALGMVGHSNDGAKPSASTLSPLTFEPVARKMKDSFCEVILPFRTDLDLREDYVNYFHGLRFGKILEDLDALAGSIAFKHCMNVTMADKRQSPLKIVTASVDKIDLLNPLRPDLDLKLSGCVTYTGRSSMEITIRVESLGNPDSKDPIDTSGIPLPEETEWAPLCLCKFTMVARDPDGSRAVEIGQLIPETEHEQKLFELGAKRKQEKLDYLKQDLRKSPPSPEERVLVHELWLESENFRQAAPHTADIAYPSETRQSSVRIMHPQERNVHSAIFGGYLMKEGFELAYLTGMMFIKGRPFTISLEDISFTKPVPIGSILFLSAEIVFAEGDPHRTFQVKVVAEVSKTYETESKEVTNTFYFTFARNIIESDGSQLSVKRLLPETYGEAMEWLGGLRRKERSLKQKQHYLDEFKDFNV